MTADQANVLEVLPIGMFEDLPENMHRVETPKNFSVILCDEHANLSRDALLTLRAAARHDLFPVYWFGANSPSFADAVFPEISMQTLQLAYRDAQEQYRRIGQVAAPHNDEDRGALNLLGYLVTRDIDAVPGWHPGSRSSVTYARLRPDLASRSLLSQLHRQGMLERTFWRKTHMCRKCSSARLNVAEYCPECRSSNLVEMDIVHHFACGHQGPQNAFQLTAGGRMICPSCEQMLNHFGVDYDKPGRVELCQNCQTVTEEPEVNFECLDCKTLTPSDEAPQNNWYQYSLTSLGRETVISGRLPVPGLETALGSFEPSKDYATFVALLDNGLSTAQRYGRPFGVCAMRFDQGQDDDHQPRLVNAASRATLIKLLREILRDSDFLYAEGEQIVFVFPETDAGQLDAIIRRIEDGLRKNMTDQPECRFEDWSDRTVRDILRGIRDVR